MRGRGIDWVRFGAASTGRESLLRATSICIVGPIRLHANAAHNPIWTTPNCFETPLE